ncbi:hypothetical protein DB35_17105 [Streptomyces abyssalis]|uniref:Uncharacterized protein n=1 Tax=Streptomyces abyssalis TaxID=933944 RepID=A0A1E7JKG1_9ACTN|nr:hypothetical protein [Streptomyces abyssalis]OEU88126.1 hypothetical protein AN215_18280 [Streptomyces abyssalis]OEU90997.1 hypothetical protein DB35_17105 [Streptomyces abyssalis]
MLLEKVNNSEELSTLPLMLDEDKGAAPTEPVLATPAAVAAGIAGVTLVATAVAGGIGLAVTVNGNS